MGSDSYIYSGVRKESCSQDITIALAGNPNVGKSTLFNSITGMNAHTGNWAGKTVDCQSAKVKRRGESYRVVDIPGTYSLFSHSDEEKIARDYILFGGADLTLVVCDGDSLEQNLNLVMQICETGQRAAVCINLFDSILYRGRRVDVKKLSDLIGVPVFEVTARKKRSSLALLDELVLLAKQPITTKPKTPVYDAEVESSAAIVAGKIVTDSSDCAYARWLALRLLGSDNILKNEILRALSLDENREKELNSAILDEKARLFSLGIDDDGYNDIIVGEIVGSADKIAKAVTEYENDPQKMRSVKVDKILTGRFSAYPLMFLLLALVFFITLSLANYPSMLLGKLFSYLEDLLLSLCERMGASEFVRGVAVSGMFRTLGQVISVMLPPMAIFFPLFSLLEDSGYLPRVAYNLDRPFAAVGACGKQALTMCMGIGCNAVGITGCRIIDSRREKLLAILTNSLVPCNGRLPMIVTLISILCLFFTTSVSSFVVAAILSLCVVLCIAATFLVTAVLSATVLRGEPSSFTIELVPYRKPQFMKVIFRSLTDKCVSVLGRAVAVAAPMGIIIWLAANISLGDGTILSFAAGILDPVGRAVGMDGSILLAFLLGIPANEIVIPLMIMIYSFGGVIPADIGVDSVRAVLCDCGWTPLTAICTIVFAFFHWPCSTSLITIYKESKSFKITALAFLIPTILGFLICAMINAAALIFF